MTTGKETPPKRHPTATTKLLLVTAATLPLLLLTVFSPPPSKPTYHSLFLSLADNDTAARHLLALTRLPHGAGSAANSAAATYVSATLSSLSFPAHTTPYDVLLSYPSHRSLSLSRTSSSTPNPFDLVQEPYPGDPFVAAATSALPTFLAYSSSGTVVGPAVFAGFGRVQDFSVLESLGVNLSGAVVVARYGKIFRGDIIRHAREAGAAAAVIYTDASDYGGGYGGEERWFPDGKWMPPSGVQVGTTYRGSGDPTTPGWPSKKGCERVGMEEIEESGMVPGIPALPVSARDGEAILQAIGGPVAPEEWQARKEAPVYHIGPGPGLLNLSYIANDTIATIENVFAVIEGEEEPDRYVLLGNHRDAWTFGAVDPNSGTAALLEAAQRLAKLQKRGWRPRRTIILCNWDAEEYGLIGSTEWVEENRETLSSRAIAYLNVDTAVAGPGFYAAATPQLDQLLIEATKKVQDPDNSSRTIYESWIASGGSSLIGRLGGGGSDFAAFVQHVGIPSIDMSFGEDYPVYHSLYDDFIWMQKFGDPMFRRNVAASVWGLLALRLADDEFLPFDYVSYACELQQSTNELENKVLDMPVNFRPLHKSIEELMQAAGKIENQKKLLESKAGMLKWRKDPLKVRELNDRLMMAERAFTDRDGLFDRQWFKHLIYGPSKRDHYGSKSFPGIDDAIENAKTLNTPESWRFVQHELWRAARAITQASLVLSGGLT